MWNATLADDVNGIRGGGARRWASLAAVLAVMLGLWLSGAPAARASVPPVSLGAPNEIVSTDSLGQVVLGAFTGGSTVDALAADTASNQLLLYPGTDLAASGRRRRSASPLGPRTAVPTRRRSPPAISTAMA